MEMMKLKSVYEKDGVVRIPFVFYKQEMDELRALAWKAFRQAPDENIQWRGDFPALLFSPQGVQKFAKDPRVAFVVKEFLGGNVTQLNDQIYFRLPGDKDQFAWHQDISFRVPEEDFDRIEEGYLQTAILIDDVTYANAPIEYLLGSHKWEDKGLVPRDGTEKGLREFTRGESFGVKMTAFSGEMLLWSVMIVHGSEPNFSHMARMYYMQGFAKSECVKTNKYPLFLKDGEIVK